MRRKLNPRYISPTREYSFKEITQIYKLHIHTVRQWPKQGLNVLEGTSCPILVLGSDLLEFFKNRDKKCKKIIKEDEFYCTRCNESRPSIPSNVQFILMKKKTGKGKKQYRIIGKCSICSCPLNRIANEDQMEVFNKKLKKAAEVEY